MFEQTILGEYYYNKEDAKLYDLVKEYYERTEEYDKSVCSRTYKGKFSIPSTLRERKLIDYNAKFTKEDICTRENVPIGEFDKAIRKFGDYILRKYF